MHLKSNRLRISLEFTPEQGPIHRKRIQYAFSLFCAIYGHKGVEAREPESADFRISYASGNGNRSSKPCFQLSNLYTCRSIREPAPSPTKFERDSESTVLFYSPLPGSEPDWLAEIFEWVSCADEYSVTTRDSIGRIDFRDSYAGRHGLDITVPYAAVAMRFLQRAICKCVERLDAGEDADQTHFIINSHDVDILPAGYLRSLQRVAKYSLVSLLVFKSPQNAARQAGKAISMALGDDNPLDQTPELLRRQTESGVGGSYFFIARHAHRRDANYRIDDPAVVDLMRTVEAHGMEVALHGSYTSLDSPSGLEFEFETLRQLRFYPRGNRQHWLRFTLEQLIPSVERTGALYDSSLGWDAMGFRAGACFAFPPYNFSCERPATFIEIPLAIMEQGMVTGGRPETDWFDDAARVLANSRRFGWGGISLLWHPTAFGPSQLPREIERIYWELIARKQQWNDAWISALDFVNRISARYIDAGLLPATFASQAPNKFITAHG